MSDSAKKHKPPASARARSSRLVAVQAVYESQHNPEPMVEILSDCMSRADRLEVDGESLVVPDGVLLRKILLGVSEKKSALIELIEKNLTRKVENASSLALEPLLLSILLCSTYELLAHDDIDTPIIINDYLDVTHSFYEDGQAKLVNGVLDALSKVLRV
jgi:N utilization substance protein B